MLLLITGASGVGKSSVREAIAPALEPRVRCVELRDVVPIPSLPDLAWRQQATEQVVQLALELQAEDRHLLLAGDPVAPGEVLAAPSAERLERIAACLLDCAPEVQRGRLLARGEPPAVLPDHLAFAAWMREHAADPGHMPEVLIDNGWEEMRWERWPAPWRGDERWNVATIDTSERTIEQVASEAQAWAEASLRGETPALG
jgi:hypothetical protein